ncbi:Putrescine transport system permease protein PotI [Planktothrix tepida]|uniref:Putrescine transport protein (ABC superfamily, membrane) n=1 Tax=Planktothrix tepida PCC 9214 TaxID=671072 RepID=A0A1J1LFK9_9CYAN|nr:ABC transporter permease [Planktothrix tepida]CAD5925398.1 Putrescine transport system permease protein PotI [Planktothrix tepida]CUR31224.1 putrescine transport protein (ABC superfamily, membrane) [Planktothrix tepida PCC 9214]
MKTATLETFIYAWGRRGLALQATFALTFLYLPILILIIYSFNASRLNSNWTGFTLKWYQKLFSGLTESTADISTQSLWISLQNSLIIAIVSTVIASILGTMMALVLERFRFPGSKVLEALLLLPIIIPEITLGVSLLVFFTLFFRILENLTGIRLTLGLPSVIISHATFSIAFITITVRARLADLDPALEEAALDLGANEWKTFWRVTFPLIFPAILSGALLAFTLSLDDFVVTFFTTGVGATTLPLFVYGMIKLSITPVINAISTLMLLASLFLVISSLKLQDQVSVKH